MPHSVKLYKTNTIYCASTVDQILEDDRIGLYFLNSLVRDTFFFFFFFFFSFFCWRELVYNFKLPVKKLQTYTNKNEKLKPYIMIDE